MEVTIYAPRTRQRGESCCVTDAEGRHWCFKVIRNIKLNGHAKCFVCGGDTCNMKAYYTSKDSFQVDGKHICAFDHEREYRKRMKYGLAIDVMTQNPLARNKDVLAAVKCHMPITLCEEKALVQFVSSRTSTTYGKVPKDLASLVIPDCLNVVGTSLDHGDKHSCFSTASTTTKNAIES